MPHIPKKNREPLETYGCDSFIGREVFDNGNECLVHYCFGSGSTSTMSLEIAAQWLYLATVKRGEVVLLDKSPGRYEKDPKDRLSNASRTYLPFNENQLEKILELYELIIKS